MKGFLTTLGLGLVVFLAIAMVQEREVFTSSWLHPEEPSAPSLDPKTRDEALARLRQFLTLLRHAYASGGDVRFIERLPASAEVIDELLKDLTYLHHNGRFQEPTLNRLVIEDVTPVAPDRLMVQTREYWITRVRFLRDHRESEPPHADVDRVVYWMRHGADGWRITRWQIVPRGEEAGENR